MRWDAFGVGVAALVVVGCGGGQAAPDPGFETGPCIDGMCLGGLACLSDVCVVPGGGTADVGDPGDGGGTTVADDTADPITSSVGDDTSGTGEPPLLGPIKLDIVFVIDNSNRMAVPQLRLAMAMPGLVEALRERFEQADVHAMVTTTDFDNPLCMPFHPPGYEPAKGAPQSRACVEHLQDFTNLPGTESYDDLCASVCPAAIAPGGDFVAFTDRSDNAAGQPEGALACLVMQGVNGCGYEAPLETMMQALNPGACWNTAGCLARSQPAFLRDDADLAIVILTDELDCTVQNYEIMNDPTLQNVDPDTNYKAASSAICFNAGVSCAGPDANGVYSDCSTTNLGLWPMSRYTSYLGDGVTAAGKRVTFVPIVGFSTDGVAATEYRAWRDGEWPAGDILPQDWANGISAASQTFTFGIGPGCTTIDSNGLTAQGLPPVRIRELCDFVDGDPNGTCCPASICAESFDDAMSCLVQSLAEP